MPLMGSYLSDALLGNRVEDLRKFHWIHWHRHSSRLVETPRTVDTADTTNFVEELEVNSFLNIMSASNLPVVTFTFVYVCSTKTKRQLASSNSHHRWPATQSTISNWTSVLLRMQKFRYNRHPKMICIVCTCTYKIPFVPQEAAQFREEFRWRHITPPILSATWIQVKPTGRIPFVLREPA